MIGLIIFGFAVESLLIWVLIGKIAYYKEHGEWYEAVSYTHLTLPTIA